MNARQFPIPIRSANGTDEGYDCTSCPAYCCSYPDAERCGYFEFLRFEREQQDDPLYIAPTRAASSGARRAPWRGSPTAWSPA